MSDVEQLPNDDKKSLNRGTTGTVQSDDNFAQLEKQWVIQAKQGDEESYKMLFEHYFPKMFGTIYQMVQNPSVAEDLTQATMVQAWRRLDRFDGRSAFGTWLYRVGINLTLDHLRRLKNRPHLSLEKEAESGFEVTDKIISPNKPIENKELKEILNEAIAKLSEPHRLVFILGEIEGKSYEEISSILKCKRGTVMSRMHYARQHLQKLLKPYYESQR